MRGRVLSVTSPLQVHERRDLVLHASVAALPGPKDTNPRPSSFGADMARPSRAGRGMRMKTYQVVIEEGEAGYLVATVRGLRGAHTQARTIGVLKRRVAEVIALCEAVEAEHRAGSRAASPRTRRARSSRLRGSFVVKVPVG